MSDPKRATLITVGAPNSGKNNVNKTVRLTINLDESNESKYPALNYKELVIVEERKKKVQNGKTTGLDPFSDNDDDVERVAKKFEQKYGGKSTYGRKGRSKTDDFADIGAGYDENDSFIDNTHGYDEMIPPECDTLYGGFYINSGSLEFKTVPENQSALSDAEPGGIKRNKRRISSSSSEEESSESSSESESQNEKDPKAIANGNVDSHKTEHRKKKNKKIDKKKAKKVRRTDSSAATSGKQTSDDNVHGDGESADSRTSHSDSLTSKPAPSSENAITSDSSRDTEMKIDVKLPSAVVQVLESLEAAVSKQLQEQPNTPAKDLVTKIEHYIIKLERTLTKCTCAPSAIRGAWTRAARAVGVPPHSLTRTLALAHAHRPGADPAPIQTPFRTMTQAQATTSSTTTATTTISSATHSSKRTIDEDDEVDFRQLTDEEREAKIVETLQRLKALIDERKPGMIASYNAECERVQVERKKIQIATAAEGAPHVEKRLPKRRFPWCPRARALLARLTRLAADQRAAAALLAHRALPLFPNGFVRMPTLLRQADLSKEIKVSEIKRQRLGSSSQPPFAQPTPTAQFTEPIQFPSSLTVTATMKTSPDKPETTATDDSKNKQSPSFEVIINSLSISKDLVVEKPDKRDSDKSKEELYNPPNNIGSITITPVPNNQPKPEKKTSNVTIEKQPSLIRVKSPAALNEMVKKDKLKKLEKIHCNVKEKRVDTPLHVDTNYQPVKKDQSPKKKEEIPQKQIENMRVAENNIPRPALVPVHHSPTFAKPDKRPPEVKKKKDIVIVSDVDPLGDVNANQEPVAVDDSSSDVEVIEESKTDKSEPQRTDNKCDTVPLKDKVSSRDLNIKKVISVKSAPKERIKDGKVDGRKIDVDEANDDIDMLMRNIREMEHSQEPTNFNTNSYGGVITSANHEKSSKQASYSSRNALYGDTRTDKDKFTERTSLNKMDGCNGITG